MFEAMVFRKSTEQNDSRTRQRVDLHVDERSMSSRLFKRGNYRLN